MLNSIVVQNLNSNSLYFSLSKNDKSDNNPILKLCIVHYTQIYKFIIFAEPKMQWIFD
jgi:hypothetical protein